MDADQAFWHCSKLWIHSATSWTLITAFHPQHSGCCPCSPEQHCFATTRLLMGNPIGFILVFIFLLQALALSFFHFFSLLICASLAFYLPEWSLSSMLLSSWAPCCTPCSFLRFCSLFCSHTCFLSFLEILSSSHLFSTSRVDFYLHAHACEIQMPQTNLSEIRQYFTVLPKSVLLRALY